ncbi:MAG TPA: hypothetical protein VFQ53_28440 [Kofleriaceae bacterium]|nr:hypothetical protein [Kofleriaceae bacterium]
MARRERDDGSLRALTRRIVDEEVAPALKAAGFAKRQTTWTRPRPGGGDHTLVLAWSPYGDARFECRGDDRARTYVMTAAYELGDDAAQISAFANSGHDAFAEPILGPLGLLEGYRAMIAELAEMNIGPVYAMTAPVPSRDVERDRLLRFTHARHRYRWSDPEALRRTLREDVQALLLVWELTAYSGNDHFVRPRIAEAFDERGYFRAWS